MLYALLFYLLMKVILLSKQLEQHKHAVTINRSEFNEIQIEISQCYTVYCEKDLWNELKDRCKSCIAAENSGKHSYNQSCRNRTSSP